MSEQDKKASGTSAGGSSVVMMEQSNTSRMKQPYRPTDLQDDSKELHHKRSKAPAVPSVTEELKGKTENMENRDQIESDAISTEKQKQAAVKKLSSIGKRRESSPETIKMAALDVESKKEIIALSSHAKPAHIGKLPSVASPKSGELEKADAEKADDDSITEEIAELRTEVVAKKESDWGKEDIPYPVSPPGPSPKYKGSRIVCGRPYKKKEISWYDGEYFDKDSFEETGYRNRAASKAWILEKKASVGPCFAAGFTGSFGEPSGIAVSIPKKSLRSLEKTPSQGGIYISFSRKLIDKSTKSCADFAGSASDRVKLPKRELRIDEVKFVGGIKGKIDNVFGKLRNILHI